MKNHAMLSMRRSAGPVRSMILAVLSAATLCAATDVAIARSQSHRGDSYGINGGVSPDLALANVYSGIYGLDYTFRRPYPGDNGVAQPVVPCMRAMQKRQGHGGATACD